jgi:hypothetical protein
MGQRVKLRLNQGETKCGDWKTGQTLQYWNESISARTHIERTA